ncbi:MAG: Xaa-Pro peptidase family protein [Deltaproteobacteria bacterium]
MRITPKTELEFRCRRLQEIMAEEGLDSIIIVQSSDLFYFTGSVQSGNLYLPAQGEPLYMVRKDAGRARMESGLKEVIPFTSPRDLPSIVSGRGFPAPVRIGMELDVLPVNFFERYRRLYPNAAFSDATPLIRRVRMIKSSYEIHIMMDAAEQADRVYRLAKEAICEGMTDIELAAILEHEARKTGHPGLIRMRAFNGEMLMGHTFSGADSAAPTFLDAPFGGMGVAPSSAQGASFKPIAKNEPVIVDFVGSVDGYIVDQTRIFAIDGLPEMLQRGYDDMLQVQTRMQELAVAGISWGHLYEECLSLACKLGYAESFMGASGSQVSFIGHGVGIEADEYPFIARGFDKMFLEIGMVFAFEPKLVFPGIGAVGIENTFYLSNEGLKRLTHSSDDLVFLQSVRP